MGFPEFQKYRFIGLEIWETEKTFHWHGKYNFDLNTRESIVTELNFLKSLILLFQISLKTVNMSVLEICIRLCKKKVVQQISNPKLIMCDTMNFWIEGAYKELTGNPQTG